MTQDDKSVDHGFVSPWFSEPHEQPTEDYFPNDYPINDELVIPADTSETRDASA